MPKEQDLSLQTQLVALLLSSILQVKTSYLKLYRLSNDQFVVLWLRMCGWSQPFNKALCLWVSSVVIWVVFLVGILFLCFSGEDLDIQ